MSRSRCPRIGLGVIAVLCLTLMATAPFASGQRFFPGGRAGGAGMVGLPHAFQDSSGNTWRIYQGGWFQQSNNMPLYSQGAMLTINGQAPNGNQARLDAKTGELVMDNMAANGCTVTRHILLDKTGGYLRYIDVIKNTQNQPQTFQVMVQSTSNYGINTGQDVPDPKKKDQTMGWVGLTGANQSIVEMYCGTAAKVAPKVNWPQGNNVVQATIALTVPGGKESAIMHLHSVAPNQDAGVKFITSLKEAPLLKSIPSALRHLIVNFRSGQDVIGDIEILRGEMLDVVELRDGDSFQGTLKESSYQLQTFYGAVTLPVDKVIGIINIGRFRPRQLIVTEDGQIYGGNLKKQTLDLVMSSGQITQIPLSQVARAGYRKRPNEPQEWTFDKPMVLMRTGERVDVQMPQGPIDVVTRYGKLSLKPEQVAAVQLQNEDNNVHEIELTDGSKFGGLLTAAEFDMKLDAGGPSQDVKFPLSAVARIQFTPKVAETDSSTPTIHLSNDDELVGSITGKLKLDTAFDTIDVNAAEMKSLTHTPDGGAADVLVSLWDGTNVNGQLEDQALTCQLLGGVTLTVPVALVQEYSQPQPRPSSAMIDTIKGLVEKDLANEDWHVRDHARTQLLSMGPAVASVLKQLRDTQPPEAQKSIDAILSDLDKQRKPPAAGTGIIPPDMPDQ
jgi:hypothetical protein